MKQVKPGEYLPYTAPVLKETCPCRDCVRLRTQQRRLTVALSTIMAVGLVVLWREIFR